ncbi:MAG: hypothetical protein ACI9TV_002124 [Sulfurimonas sp.]|jgi:hypothetical protein|uniref:C10 family peptidase n=1 Tax=Sulfurimonas sp. TaxID=2022749 RepID=UPI0039E63E11
MDIIKIAMSAIVLGSLAHAKVITEEETKNIALNKAFKESAKSYKIKELIEDDKLFKKTSKYAKYLEKDSKIRLIKLDPQGWVLVAGNDNATPVIGYSLKSKFDENNLPPQLEELLGEFSKSLFDLNNKKDKSTNAKKITNPEYLQLVKEREEKWKNLNQEHKQYKAKHPFKKTDNSVEVIGNYTSSFTSPTLKLEKETEVTTPLWNQDEYYNTHAPLVPSNLTSLYGFDGRSPTGCAATAMAEIMRYHSWPNNANLVSYNDINGSMQQQVDAYDTNHQYNWNIMEMTDLVAPNDEVTLLMHHAALAVEMNFENNNSSSNAAIIANVMRDNFGYQFYAYLSRDQLANDTIWRNLIYTDLRQGFPIIYSGFGTSGHTFLIDGFDSEDNDYHINFGWGGAGNGYYIIDGITPGSYAFSDNAIAIFGLKPNNSEYRDVFEKDNTWEKSSYLPVGSVQLNHSIAPASDEDWMTFWNDTLSDIKIQTYSNSSTGNYRDTQLFLYDYYGNEVAFNEDYESGGLSKIEVDDLSSGRYYVKVKAASNSKEISSYDINIVRN